jgi:hypothetical protein
MNPRSLATARFLIILLLTFSLHSVFAQSADTGAIFGTISDTTGASLPATSVTVSNEQTGVSSTLTTNGQGFFSKEAMASGDYTVVLRRDGFKGFTIQHVHLDPGQRRDVSERLTPGGAQEAVTVQANTLQVKTETSEDSSTIGSKEISTLLVNGRNFQSLATLNPGVNNTNGNSQYSGGGLSSTTTLSIGGTGTDDTTYSIDGVYNMNTGNYINLNVSPSMDVISEFTVLKANYSSRYGTASNSTVLVDTKSGTETYHGSLWDYFRNDAMDASDYYSKGVKTALHQNIYGFSLGGPLQIPRLYDWHHNPKTFFFASDEWWAKTTGNTATAFVITKAMRTGNLAGSIGLPTAGLTLTAQGQSLLAAEGKTNCIASATVLNPSCIDQDAITLLNTYEPTENASNPSFNYVNYAPSTFSQIDHDYRIDHEFSPKEMLTGRFMYEQVDDFAPSATTISDSTFTSGLNMMMRLTSTFGSNIVNTASVAETFDKPRLHTTAATIPTGVQIAYFYPDANTTNSIPNISIGGYEGFGPGSRPVNASDGEGIINDDFSLLVGKHSLQVGGFYIFGIKNQITTGEPWGNMSFGGTYTGSGAADYLLGLHDSFTQQSAKPHYTAHYRSTEFYVQDDWKATPRLTINAGMRFFYYSPDWLTGPNSETSSFNPSQFNAALAPIVLPSGIYETNSASVPITATGTVADLDNGLVFNTTPGVPRGFFHDSMIDPAPRVGFAYALTSDNRTSVHGGYGVGYTRVPFRIADALTSNPPGVANVDFLSGTIENPTAGAEKIAVPTPQALVEVNTHFRASQIQSFSLIVERQLFANAVFQVGYAGSLGRHLRIDTDQNQVKPTNTPYSLSCLAKGQAPSAVYDFDPCLNTNAVSSAYLRPYQGISSINEYVYVGNDNYNSLQSQFRVKRKSWQTTLNYTYGKAMGDANGGSNYRTSYSTDQNSYCLTCEYGPRNFDRTHIFSGNIIYALPLTNATTGWKRELIGGWSLSGIALLESGFALTPSTDAPDTALASRPNRVGPLHNGDNWNQIFNPNAFAVPAYGFFGDAAVGSIRGPRQISYNTALYKTFPVRGRINFQLRAEAFNVANHPTFNGVNTGIGPDDPDPGVVNSPADPRIMEIVGRISF